MNRKIQALVVDNARSSASQISEFLAEAFNAQVETAYDLVSARDRLSSKSFDIIILDYDLPGGGGLDFLEEIRSADESPQVIMTACGGNEQAASEAFEREASGYVVRDGNMLRGLIPAVVDALSSAERQQWDRERGV